MLEELRERSTVSLRDSRQELIRIRVRAGHLCKRVGPTYGKPPACNVVRAVVCDLLEGLRHLRASVQGSTPSKRHGPGTLAESVDKVRYLKELGAHAWDLSGVSLAKQQAYARQVQARRPVKSREIKPSRQLIELVCFLRVALLELIDVALLQSSRRRQQLFREAADKAQAKRVRGTTGLIQQVAMARTVLHDESKSWQARQRVRK